ncbi:hypothetical protein B0T26DRAFT_683043 [Lasiosphaeria miniovina]|uniref:Uncharacterized protein n=1 Tax=Lasiosphaeria miniovina TaxID=1954250 RepID=A0AA40ED98_9PEZI|nr:uncharacterized protein B0T26DRAFT_683043 [Lasiosphaeria miniovina]KAK0733176.1 hypothetical protein B0T26DRAFT_683043 [Lasiosphaeria miniovina]
MYPARITNYTSITLLFLVRVAAILQHGFDKLGEMQPIGIAGQGRSPPDLRAGYYFTTPLMLAPHFGVTYWRDRGVC